LELFQEWGRGIRRTTERVNSSIIYLIYCKSFCTCHNVPPPSTTNKKWKRKSRILFFNSILKICHLGISYFFVYCKSTICSQANVLSMKKERILWSQAVLVPEIPRSATVFTPKIPRSDIDFNHYPPHFCCQICFPAILIIHSSSSSSSSRVLVYRAKLMKSFISTVVLTHTLEYPKFVMALKILCHLFCKTGEWWRYQYFMVHLK
jgi:hypothetical protein